MGTSFLSSLRRGFYPLGIVAAAATALAVSVVFTPVIGVRGGYAAIGLTLGAVVYYRYDLSRERRPSEHRLRWSTKGVYLLALVALTIAAVTEQRLFVLLTLLPVGYFLLAIQLRANRSPRVLLPQVVALFAIAPVTKYLTTGFYFGDGDLLFHSLHVEQVLARGTAAAIRGPVDQYRVFPGFHLLVASFRLLTDLSVYDSLLSAGILTYTLLVVPMMFLLARVVFRRSTLAVFVALGASLVYSVSYHTTYFFPQSLVVPLLLFFLYIMYRSSASWKSHRRAWVALAVVLQLAALFTHHLSFVLLTPIVLFFGGVSLVNRVAPLAKRTEFAVVEPRFLPILAGWAAAITYWTVASESFIFNVAWWGSKIVGDLLGPTSGGVGDSIVALGTTVPEQTTAAAVHNLVAVNSLYLTGLMAVFSLGVVTVLEYRGEFRRSTGLLLVGIASALLVFKTPVVFPGLNRIRMPFAFFFAIVLGVGAYRLIRATNTASTARIVPLALFLLLATTAPLYVIGGDDLYDLHDPPNGPPQKQVEFSETEYQSLGEVTAFAEEHEVTVRTFWIDRMAVQQFGGETMLDPNVTESGISGEPGVFVYRDRWTDHLVHHAGDTWGKFIISDEWLEQNVRRHTKVYDSGTVGMLWTDERLRLDNHEDGNDGRPGSKSR